MHYVIKKISCTLVAFYLSMKLQDVWIMKHFGMSIRTFLTFVWKESSKSTVITIKIGIRLVQPYSILSWYFHVKFCKLLSNFYRNLTFFNGYTLKYPNYTNLHDSTFLKIQMIISFLPIYSTLFVRLLEQPDCKIGIFVPISFILFHMVIINVNTLLYIPISICQHKHS